MIDLKQLEGRVVLVESATDRHHPPTGIRGSLEVVETRDGTSRLRIAYDLPQMFGRNARRRSIDLNASDVDQLLASERNGSFEFVLTGPLDPTPGYRND